MIKTPVSHSKPFEDATLEAYCAGKGIVDALGYLDRETHVLITLDYCGESGLIRAHHAGTAKQALKELARARESASRLIAALDVLEPLLIGLSE